MVICVGTCACLRRAEPGALVSRLSHIFMDSFYQLIYLCFVLFKPGKDKYKFRGEKDRNIGKKFLKRVSQQRRIVHRACFSREFQAYGRDNRIAMGFDYKEVRYETVDKLYIGLIKEFHHMGVREKSTIRYQTVQIRLVCHQLPVSVHR